ncbi:MAG: DNA-processing protein DprA [Acidobacteria bacterium]|nr:DNA-processing protein DprA [Acidobacteriota bacterium]
MDDSGNESPKRSASHTKGTGKISHEAVADVSTEAEQSAGITLGDLTDLLVLESVNQFGPQKFKELHAAKITPHHVLLNPDLLPIKGKRGDTFRAEIRALTDEVREECRRRAANQIIAAAKYKAKILTYDHSYYPRNVYESNNPIPVLYVRGSLVILRERNVVGCVGSRKIRPPYYSQHAEFARTAVDSGFVVVSGFALGADTVGHEAAFKHDGQTICVMPGGLERPFPPENKHLWEDLLASDKAAFVTEFGFGVRAAALTLKKRNKLIVAFAKGVLVGQSAASGGAMNAYRFSREQHKPVATFAEDGSDDTSGNKLIAEEKKPGDEIFPSGISDLTAYKRWLHQLSSSI